MVVVYLVVVVGMMPPLSMRMTSFGANTGTNKYLETVDSGQRYSGTIYK